jgi:serine/threonine protein kinase
VVDVSSAPNFGRYKVTSTLGAGAMGEVYAAVDEVLGREVAVKTLRGADSGFSAAMLDERFRMEARAIARLAHPGVVQVFDIDLNADPPYLVMERVTGPSLKERLAEGPLSLPDLRALGIQIARALAAAHVAGIVHRDVKPANILVAGDSLWKLADFGVAHVPDSSMTMTGQFMGSPAYAPPEALVRGQCIPAGDVFGLGASLYQAAVGRWPRADATSGALLAAVPPVRELAPALPVEVASAIDRALSNQPELRPSAAELADALASTSSATSIPLPPRTSVLASAQRLRWKPWVIGAMAVLLIAILIAARSPGSGPSSAGTGAIPGPIRIDPPPIRDKRAAKDWNKLIEQVQRGRIDEALDKLEEFEDRHGVTPETDALRAQLQALPMEFRAHDD